MTSSEDEISIKWKYFNSDSHKLSKDKKTVECFDTGQGNETGRVFSNYKIKKEDVKIKIKIKSEMNMHSIGFAYPNYYDNKTFTWDESQIEWYSDGSNSAIFYEGKRQNVKNVNNLVMNKNDVVEIIAKPSKKEIIFKNKKKKLKEKIKNVKFPLYLSCTLWYKDHSIEIVKVKKLDDEE
jgi:hypothetical protein